MWKHRKLRSSVKILQEVLTSFSPSVARPFCVEPRKAHLSRGGIISGSNSPNPKISASSAALHNPRSHTSLFIHVQNEGCVEGVAVSVSAVESNRGTSASCLSSTASSSLPAAACDPTDSEQSVHSGMINSRRFFFSPCSSKSIAKRGGDRLSLGGTEDSTEETEEAGKDNGVKAFETFAETEEDIAIEEWKREESSGIFGEISTPMVVVSREPYEDFRKSMEEMVMVHGLQDWTSLKELLHCFLRLNEKKTHGIIVLAFVDLLMHLSLQSPASNEAF